MGNRALCPVIALLLLVAVTSLQLLDHGPPGQATRVVRLPLEVEPLHYQLTLAPYFQADGDFESRDVYGEVIIDATTRSTPTKNITLHAGNSVTFSAADVRVLQSQDYGDPIVTFASAVTFDADNEMVSIQLEKEIYGNLSLQIKFLGQLRTDMDGFYLSQYQHNNHTKFLASTQFAPMSARKAFPCFDEPALKATFSVVVLPPEGYGVLSNMVPTVGDTSSGVLSKITEAHSSRSRAAVRFEATRRVSTYLVAFVVFDEQTFGADEMATAQGPLRVWSRHDRAGQRGLGLDVAAAALDAYGRLFPDYFVYMNSKLDQVAVPDFYFGAMENWGLITYRERALLIDDQQSSSAAQRYAVTTMSHELAHQWFGDLVTPDFWNVLWLKEGFATYWAYHVDLGQLTYDWDLSELFLAEQMALALDGDARESTHALTSAPNTAALYDDISYSKGGSILRMFRYWIGEDEFNKGLNIYLNNRMFDSALPEDLFDAIAPGNNTIAKYMDIWTSTPGYPVLHVTRTGTTATLRQERYFLTPPKNGTYGAPWPVLVFYAVGTAFDESSINKTWLIGEEEVTIDGLENEQPLFVNLEWSGFYRVNYDKASRRLLQQQMSSDHMAVPKVTRAQLLSDIFSLGRSEHVAYHLALDFSKYLHEEEDYLPWAITFRNLEFLETILIPFDNYGTFRKYVIFILEQLSSELTFSAQPEDDHLTNSLRAGMAKWLCRVGYSTCLELAQELAESSFNSSSSSVNPDLRAAVYCVWARDMNLWNIMWEYYLKTTVATESQEMLSALGCSQDESTLKKYLLQTLDPAKIRPQDMQTVFTGVYSTPIGLEVAMDFISDHAKALIQESRYAEKIISGLASKVVTDNQLSKLNHLTTVEALGKLNGTLDSAISTATAQVQWAKKHVNGIINWLKVNIPVPSRRISKRSWLTEIDIPVSQSSISEPSLLTKIIPLIIAFFIIKTF